MGKIHNSEIHASEDASIWYGGIVVHAIRQVRRSIESLKKSKKADQSVMGGIHALRKLLEDEESYFGLAEGEVREWMMIIEKWFEKAKRYIPKNIQEDYKNNLDEDLKIILDKSTDTPEYMWRKKSLERQIVITVESEEVKDRYYRKTEEKHPVQLGNSLNEYVKKCLNTLINEENINSSPDISIKPSDDNTLNLAVRKNKTNYALVTDDFEFYNSDENREQGISINAYDMEDAIKLGLDNNSEFDASLFKFDCESSLLYVSSEKLDALKQITDILFSLSTNDIIK